MTSTPARPFINMSARTKAVNVQGVSLVWTIREADAVRHFLPKRRNVLDQSLIVTGNKRCMCLCAQRSVSSTTTSPPILTGQIMFTHYLWYHPQLRNVSIAVCDSSWLHMLSPALSSNLQLCSHIRNMISQHPPSAFTGNILFTPSLAPFSACVSVFSEMPWHPRRCGT